MTQKNNDKTVRGTININKKPLTEGQKKGQSANTSNSPKRPNPPPPKKKK